MSSESDVEEFYDAEEKPLTPVKSIKSDVENIEKIDENVQSSKEETTTKTDDLSLVYKMEEEIKEANRKAQENEKRRRKVEELRRRMLTDDDDDAADISSEQSSRTSTDGLHISYNKFSPLQKETMGSKSDDLHSIISLGKLGSILGDKESLSSISNEESSKTVDLSSTCYNLDQGKSPEPDVVASTRNDRTSEFKPVAPPRRKRHPPSSLTSDGSSKSLDSVSIKNTSKGLPSPITAVENLAQELEYSLDIHSATKGQYVVKPQDYEQDRAEDVNISSKTNFNGQKLNESIKKESNTPEGSVKQMNMVMRTRSDSGRPLTDLEILEQVTVLNLDTGELVPLSLAEDRLPKCVNPLSLHIMRLTSEYVSKWIRKKIEKTVEKTVNKLKDVADEVKHSRHSEDIDTSEEETMSPDARPSVKIKASGSHKGPYEFEGIKVLQELTGEHSGAIWTMKFSSCGRLLASAGQDHILRIWVLRDSYSYFDDMRQRYNADGKVSPTPSQENIGMQQNDDHAKSENAEASEDMKGPFMPKPFCTYEGHTADLLDISWSKNYFILSSSMDKTVRLWHISRRECLCCFQHIDFVTAIAFHPRDDRYFLSGSLDGKLRLWNIPDKKVALWNELDGQTKLITTVSFCQNGKFAVIGSYDGRCIFYYTEQLKYYTQIHVRSTRGKNAQGRKISGIEPMPGEDKILVTSNDSRIRLYDLCGLTLSCKYKGYVNVSSQIRASFSHDGKYVISGSENQFIYIWKTHHDYSKFSSARRDRNDYWEGIKAHNAVVTTAVFAPHPHLISCQLDQNEQHCSTTDGCYVIASADFSGAIKIFINKPKTKSSGATDMPAS
ncbi:WD repeat-containing protein 44 isoform X2 [Centruroides vittatus]|uniref:WD repeat-containing protein 44 isoform X2 n=1 Tax=Centruroides vittatus TaxID=120091 RepID=UPI0035104A8D